MEELTAKIDRFLSDKMTSEEKSAFLLEVEQNAELRQEIELQKKTTELLEAGSFIALKEKVGSLNKKESNLVGIKPLLRIAAMLVILLIPTYFFISSRYSDTNLFMAYAEPYPDRITNMGEQTDEVLVEAMNLYNEEKYKDAAEVFKSIRSKDVKNEQITLYEAVSLTQSGQSKEAIVLLNETLLSGPDNIVAFEWQLILAYLANDEGDKAKDLLDLFLKHNNGYQQENAESLLADLNSFWH